MRGLSTAGRCCSAGAVRLSRNGRRRGDGPGLLIEESRVAPGAARPNPWSTRTLGSTAPRWVVGFEGVLGALRAALDGGVFTSIHGGVEERHRLFGEVAAVAGDPFVVGVDQYGPDESDHGGGVGKDPHDTRLTYPADLLRDQGVGVTAELKTTSPRQSSTH